MPITYIKTQPTKQQKELYIWFLGRKQIYAKLTTTVVINPTTSPNSCPLIKYWMYCSNKVLFHCTFHLDLVLFYISVHF